MILSIYILLNKIFGDVITLQRVKTLLFVVLPVVVIIALFVGFKSCYTNHEINITANKIEQKDAQIENANLNRAIANQQTANANRVTINANLGSKRAEEILNNSRANRSKGVTGNELNEMANNWR